MSETITVSSNGYKNIIERQTDILFPSAEDMEQAFAQFGIKTREPFTVVRYKYKGKELGVDVVRFIKENPEIEIPLEEIQCQEWLEVSMAKDQIKSVFLLNHTSYLLMWSNRIRCYTYNLKPHQHHAEMHKIYGQLKPLCPGIEYTCRKETVSDECKV